MFIDFILFGADFYPVICWKKLLPVAPPAAVFSIIFLVIVLAS